MLFYSRIRNERRMALLRELDASGAINTAGQSALCVFASGDSVGMEIKSGRTLRLDDLTNLGL